MICWPNLQGAILASTEATARRNQVDGVENAATVVTLITTSQGVTAMWAGSFNVTVGQEAAIRWAVGRQHSIFEDVPFIVKREKEILRDSIVIFGTRLSI